MIPANQDTLPRLLTRLSLFATDQVIFEGKVLNPILTRTIVLGDSLFRKFVCVPECKACCTFPHTLDFIPRSESLLHAHDHTWLPIDPREVIVNDEKFTVMTMSPQDKLSGGEKLGCTFLRKDVRGKDTYGCCIWPNDPVECQASLIFNPRTRQDKPGEIHITKQGWARAWTFKETPQCEFKQVSIKEMGLGDIVKVIRMYREWADYFKIKTSLEAVEYMFISIIDGRTPPGRKELVSL